MYHGASLYNFSVSEPGTDTPFFSLEVVKFHFVNTGAVDHFAYKLACVGADMAQHHHHYYRHDEDDNHDNVADNDGRHVLDEHSNVQ